MLLNHLLIFAKYPEPGRVKTRLARSIGPERAALLYQEMVETVVAKTAPTNGEYRRTVYFDPPERRSDFEKWFCSLTMKSQCEGDLGSRMRTAIAESLQAGADRSVLIGSDCPAVNRELIVEAFRKLADADLVIGPASDGGYYLIGMKAVHDVFAGIPWSTGRVFAETIRRIMKAGLTVSLLPILADVDQASDLALPIASAGARRPSEATPIIQRCE